MMSLDIAVLLFTDRVGDILSFDADVAQIGLPRELVVVYGVVDHDTTEQFEFAFPR